MSSSVSQKENNLPVRICAIACVAVGILAWFGIAKSDVKKLCTKANTEFSESVEPHLDELSNASNGLAMTMVNYPSCSDSMTALRVARNALIDAKTVSDEGSAYVSMKQAFTDAYADISSQDLTDTEVRNISAYNSSFQAQVSAIEASSYNELAQEAQQKLSGGLAKTLAGDNLPEVFG